MNELVLKNVSKTYGESIDAVKGFNLSISNGEFIVIIGPSGCGKSTVLRMIAGLEKITDGEIFLDDQLINQWDARERNMAMVFQNYALYENMTVYDNIAFPLRMKKVSKDIINQQVTEVCEILSLSSLIKRRPGKLSGGERQRVALGRAMVRNPRVFLLDEPLSNLDAKLRNSMRYEITRLHKHLKTTFIYVTHDQTEAMTMADRIVIMKDGIVQQEGTPMSVYDKPSNTFVAGFIGTPQMNFIQGRVVDENFVFGNEGKYKLSDEQLTQIKGNGDLTNVILGIRPEHINIKPDGKLEMVVENEEFTGTQWNISGAVCNERLTIKSESEMNCDKIRIDFDEDKIHLFGQTEKDEELRL